MAYTEKFRNEWKNKGGTSQLPSCGCGSWKNHWLNDSGRDWPRECSCDGCHGKAEDGGHIVSATNGRGDVYIVPMCKSCNSPYNTKSFFLKPGTVLVAANKQKICER